MLRIKEEELQARPVPVTQAELIDVGLVYHMIPCTGRDQSSHVGKGSS